MGIQLGAQILNPGLDVSYLGGPQTDLNLCQPPFLICQMQAKARPAGLSCSMRPLVGAQLLLL